MAGLSLVVLLAIAVFLLAAVAVGVALFARKKHG